MHIPSSDTGEITINGFYEALAEAQRPGMPYDGSKWLYVPGQYEEYRYILGTRGENPLICIGINPSTAAPDDLDNTLKSVERIAHANGYKCWMMFNVYAQRATNPDDMEQECNRRLHEENMKAFEYVLQNCGCAHPSVWAAWGTIIEKRPYLFSCVADMIKIGKKYGAVWFTAGQKSKKGHPHHPLYLKKDAALDEYQIEDYTRRFLADSVLKSGA